MLHPGLRCFHSLSCLLLGFSFLSPTFSTAQDSKDAAAQKAKKDKETVENAARQGIPFTAETVNANVRVQAVLLPSDVSKHVFGKEIANNYAAIEMAISNKSADATFILHDIFIDYRDWGLSGVDASHRKRSTVKANSQSGIAIETTQTSTLPGQVGCTEYRIARGDLLDAQQWTARNWTVRIITLAGSIASGFTFTVGQDAAKGIAAFNGNVVPGVAAAWPDGIIGQLNRISDVGFQTNKVIPKQSSDVVVCFYPLKRFLTPGFEKIFQKSPALFFAPLAFLEDKKAQNIVKPFLHLTKPQLDGLQEALPCYMNDLDSTRSERSADSNCSKMLTDEKLQLFSLLQRISLNNIHIIVDGVMSIDVNLVPAQIEDIQFTDPADAASFWAVPGTKHATVIGTYLDQAEVQVPDSDKLKVTNIQTISDGSNDKHLKFW